MIYYAQHEVSKQIKIGCTRSLKERMRALRGAYGPICLLATEPGDRLLEYQIHQLFDEWHLEPEMSISGGNEWFIPSSNLLDYIDQLQRISAFESKIKSQMI